MEATIRDVNPSFDFLRSITQDQNRYDDIFVNPDTQCVSMLHTSIESLLNEILSILRLSKNLKSIFLAAPEVSSSASTEDSIKTLITYLCKSIECEDATVYAIDEHSGQLWSQISGKLGDNHTIAIGSGLIGYAVQ